MNIQEIQQIQLQTERLIEELATAKPITLVLSANLAYLVVAQLELASEHPLNQGFPTISNDLKMFVDELRNLVLQRCSPDTANFIRETWK